MYARWSGDLLEMDVGVATRWVEAAQLRVLRPWCTRRPAQCASPEVADRAVQVCGYVDHHVQPGHHSCQSSEELFTPFWSTSSVVALEDTDQQEGPAHQDDEQQDDDQDDESAHGKPLSLAAGPRYPPRALLGSVPPSG